MTTQPSIRIRTVAVLGGGVLAGVIGASAFSANAQTTAAGVPSSTASSPTDQKVTKTHGTETVVTGTKAAALKTAALEQAPGATIKKITTEDSSDSTGAAYEVHLTTAGGTDESLLFKSDLTYVSTDTGGGRGGHGHGGHGGGAGEPAVTGADAATLTAAALKQVPGATVDEVTKDSGDAAYEVHLTKADGTDVTAKFDKNLKFVAVESGRGK